MEEYITTLKERGIFAKLVNVANIAYHSKHIKPIAPKLLQYLKEVISSILNNTVIVYSLSCLPSHIYVLTLLSYWPIPHTCNCMISFSFHCHAFQICIYFSLLASYIPYTSTNQHSYSYLYIYICVYVCVCLPIYEIHSFKLSCDIVGG